jgi:predicted amidophosphoribosyltransferase
VIDAVRDALLPPRYARCATPGAGNAVVPVTLDRARALARGYDHAALRAAAVRDQVALPLRPALHRIRADEPQVRLDRRSRASNARTAFVAGSSSLRGLSVALVDDVATTGATLLDAAAAARAAGVRGVPAYVVAVDE